jgi:hypothetical protein
MALAAVATDMRKIYMKLYQSICLENNLESLLWVAYPFTLHWRPEWIAKLINPWTFFNNRLASASRRRSFSANGDRPTMRTLIQHLKYWYQFMTESACLCFKLFIVKGLKILKLKSKTPVNIRKTNYWNQWHLECLEQPWRFRLHLCLFKGSSDTPRPWSWMVDRIYSRRPK